MAGATEVNAPVIVRRRDDQPVWQGSPCRSEVLRILTQATPLTRIIPLIWSSDTDTDHRCYNWPPQTSNILFNLTQQKIFGAGGQVPTKQWEWNYTPDPVWTWQAPPSDTLRELTQAIPFNSTVPLIRRADYDSGIAWWQGAPVTINIETLARSPAIPPPPQFDNVPDTYWTWQAPPSDTLRELTQARPFYKLWRWDHVPQPDWTWTAPPSDTLRELTQANPFSKLWRYDYDSGASWWQGAPAQTNIQTFPSTVTYLPTAPLWVMGKPDVPFWTGTPTASPIVSQITQNPFVLRQWLDLFVPEPPWTWNVPPSDTLRLLTEATPFARLWRWDHVPSPDWTWTAPSSNTLDILIEGGTPFSKFWRWDNVPDPVWQGSPVATNLKFFPPTNPFFRLWKYDWDSSSWWTWQAPPSDTLRELTQASPLFRLWQWNHVPEPPWTWVPPSVSKQGLLNPASPFRRLWQWDHVPLPVWTWIAPPVSQQGLFNPAKPIVPPNYAVQLVNFDAFWLGVPIAVSTSILGPTPPPFVRAIEWILRARRRHNR
jgi:hypothetical protein